MKEVENREKSKYVMNIKGCDLSAMSSCQPCIMIKMMMMMKMNDDDDEDERVCQPANNKLHVGLWQSRVIGEAGNNQTTLDSSFYLSTLI